MNVVEPYARMMPVDGLALLRHVEWCARISHRSEDAVTQDSWQRIIKAVVLDHGDWSVTEHAVVSVDALVDRGITHEWVRHRLASYTQESTRFVNYEKKMPPSFIRPDFSQCRQAESAERAWAEGITIAENQYKNLLVHGAAPQLARSVFPNSLASRLICTMNLRSWRHFFIMRTTKEAHPQMRQVTIPLLAEFQAAIPLLYDDIVPEQKQSEAMKKAR